MKFSRKKESSLLGHTEVTFRHEGMDTFKMSGSQFGVILNGAIELTTMAELQTFADVLSQAWAAHRELMPKLMTTPSGH